MRHTLLQTYRDSLLQIRWRRLFLSLAAMVLLVQTGFPAHQDTHPIGSNDNQCQYCVMAGHAVGVPSAAVVVPAMPVHMEYRQIRPVEFQVSPFPRTRFSRGPPTRSIA